MGTGKKRFNPSEVDDLIVGKALLDLPSGAWIGLEAFDNLYKHCVADLRNSTSRKFGQVETFMRVVGKMQIGTIQLIQNQASLKMADSTASLDQQRRDNAEQHADDNRQDSILSAELGTEIVQLAQTGRLSGSKFIAMSGKAPTPAVTRYFVSSAPQRKRGLQFGKHEVTLGGVPDVPKVLTDGVASIGFKLGAPASRREGWRSFYCQAKGNCPALGLAAGASFSLHFDAREHICQLLMIAQALAIDIEAKVSSTVKTATGKREYLVEAVHNLSDIQTFSTVFFSKMTAEQQPVQAEFIME